MTGVDPERERLEKAERETHGRFLRLESFHDARVVAAARMLWKASVAELAAYRAEKKNADRSTVP